MTTAPTPTPRTDAFVEDYIKQYGRGEPIEALDLCRTLERELVACQKQLGECSGGYETLQKELADALRARPGVGVEPVVVAWRYRKYGAERWSYTEDAPDSWMIRECEIEAVYSHPPIPAPPAQDREARMVELTIDGFMAQADPPAQPAFKPCDRHCEPYPNCECGRNAASIVGVAPAQPAEQGEGSAHFADDGPTAAATLADDLSAALNRHCAENASNTPDFILANFLIACLAGYDAAVIRRAEWYGRIDSIGGAVERYPPAQPAEQGEEKCEWSEDSDGVWNTDCGHAWSFDDGGPADNGCGYCCFCGGKLLQCSHQDTRPPSAQKEKRNEWKIRVSGPSPQRR